MSIQFGSQVVWQQYESIAQMLEMQAPQFGLAGTPISQMPFVQLLGCRCSPAPCQPIPGEGSDCQAAACQKTLAEGRIDADIPVVFLSMAFGKSE